MDARVIAATSADNKLKRRTHRGGVDLMGEVSGAHIVLFGELVRYLNGLTRTRRVWRTRRSGLTVKNTSARIAGARFFFLRTDQRFASA